MIEEMAWTYREYAESRKPRFGKKFNENDAIGNAVQDAYDKYRACETEPKICQAIKINDDGTEQKTSIWMDRGNSIGGIVKAIKDGRLRKVLKFSESSKPRFVKESTGDMVEVKAVISGAGETIEEALDNFKNELISVNPDQWGEWTNCDGEDGDKDWWIQQYYKWNEENGGDVDMKVFEDDGVSPEQYARVDIRNTTY